MFWEPMYWEPTVGRNTNNPLKYHFNALLVFQQIIVRYFASLGLEPTNHMC